MDTYLTITSGSLQGLVVILLLRKRIYKEFPLFSAYQAWLFCVVTGASIAAVKLPADAYDRLFFTLSILDSLFMFSILVEMSMSVLKPVKSLLPRWTILLVVALIGAVATGVWKIASPPGATKLSMMSQLNIHLDITTSVLRILFFLSLAAFSQLLCLGWRDRVVQISTGLGFFSLVSLCVTFLHMNQGVGGGHLNELYHVLDRIVVVSYIASMVYWLVSFARAVRERQEFTPQMQKFFEALAQNARSTQLSMRSPDAKSGESY